MFKTNTPCEVCGYYRSSPGHWLRGRELSLCTFCLLAGNDFELSDPWARPGFDCLHQIAVGLEHFSAVPYGQEFTFDHWLRRLQRNILSGELRDVCGCVTCNGLRNAPGVAGQLDGDLVDLFDEDVPLFILRSMQPSSVLFCSDGSQVTVKEMIERHLQRNMEDTARGPVGPLAASAVAVRPLPSESPEELARAQRYWRGFHLFGPVGYLDGFHWIDSDGVAHVVPDRLPQNG